MADVFITGGTGYMGRSLIAALVKRGHAIRALVRPGSESKLHGLCPVVVGDALDAASFAQQVAPADTFVQLVGYPKPDPRKAKEFRAVDLRSGLAGVSAAREAGIRHFVYVSVAHPAPMMKAYIEPRMEVEAAIRAAGLNATILRPWYVLGPGHWWPYMLLPLYALFELLPGTRDSARRLGLVTLKQMTDALVKAIENPSQGIGIVEVTDIRRPL
jgi:uncharacterized protein YbjT (DUF2867 family)